MSGGFPLCHTSSAEPPSWSHSHLKTVGPVDTHEEAGECREHQQPALSAALTGGPLSNWRKCCGERPLPMLPFLGWPRTGPLLWKDVSNSTLIRRELFKRRSGPCKLINKSYDCVINACWQKVSADCTFTLACIVNCVCVKIWRVLWEEIRSFTSSVSTKASLTHILCPIFQDNGLFRHSVLMHI